MLLLVIVIVLDQVIRFAFAQNIRSFRKFSKETDEHLHDSCELFFSANDLFLSRELSSDEDV